MYHTAALELASTVADILDIPHRVLESNEMENELQPLQDYLQKTKFDALVHGGIESNYQKERLQKICNSTSTEEISPLWHRDREELLMEIINELDVIITQVAADGLTQEWIGRNIDAETANELIQLSHEKGIHILGEGGEYESAVISTKQSTNYIDIEYTTHWDGLRGYLEPTEIKIQEK